MNGTIGGGANRGEVAGIRGVRAMFEQNTQSNSAAAISQRHAPLPQATALAAATAAAATGAAGASGDRKPFKVFQQQPQQQQQQDGGRQVAAIARQTGSAAGHTHGVVASGGAANTGFEYSGVGQGQRSPSGVRKPALPAPAVASALAKQSPAITPKPTPHSSSALPCSPKAREAANNANNEREDDGWPMPPAERMQLLREMQNAISKRQEAVCVSQAFVNPTGSEAALNGSGMESSNLKKKLTPTTDKPESPRDLSAPRKCFPPTLGPHAASLTTGFDFGRARSDAVVNADAESNSMGAKQQAAVGRSALLPPKHSPLAVKPKSDTEPTTAGYTAEHGAHPPDELPNLGTGRHHPTATNQSTVVNKLKPPPPPVKPKSDAEPTIAGDTAEHVAHPPDELPNMGTGRHHPTATNQSTIVNKLKPPPLPVKLKSDAEPASAGNAAEHVAPQPRGLPSIGTGRLPTASNQSTVVNKMKTPPLPVKPKSDAEPTTAGDTAEHSAPPPDGLPSAGAERHSIATNQLPAVNKPKPPLLPVKPYSPSSQTTAEPVVSPSPARSVRALAELLSNAKTAESPPAIDSAARQQVLDKSGRAYELLPFPVPDKQNVLPTKPASVADYEVVLPVLRWEDEMLNSGTGSVGSSDKQQPARSSPLPSPSSITLRRATSDSDRPPTSASRQMVSMIEPMQSDEEEYDDATASEVFAPPVQKPLPELPRRPMKPAQLLTGPIAAEGGGSCSSDAIQGGDDEETYDDIGADGELYDDARPEARKPVPRGSESSSSSEPNATSTVSRKESKRLQKQAEQEALRLRKEEQKRLAKEELAQEEERRQREKLAEKAAKVRQALMKDQAKIRKKFKLKEGDETFIRLATMRQSYMPAKPGSVELPYAADEVLYVVVKDGCPKGKWLAKNSANLLGFVTCDSVAGASGIPNELDSPVADEPTDEPEEVEYADAEEDDVAGNSSTSLSSHRIGSGAGNCSASGSILPAAQTDDTYDDTGAAETENDEDVYEMAD